jgi:hypothetical protein
MVNLEYKSYIEKRQVYRDYARKEEISDCVNFITDEIYSRFNVKYGSEPIVTRNPIQWEIIKKYLIDGYLAFEITEISSRGNTFTVLNEIDVSSLLPCIKNNKRIWVQYPTVKNKKRVLLEDQIAYISYNDNGSYVEKLIRPYDIMKLAEDAYVISCFLNMPGLNVDKSSIESVKYFEKKFRKAALIPKYYTNNTFGFENDSRFEKYINRHVLNIYSIYDKIKKLK